MQSAQLIGQAAIPRVSIKHQEPIMSDLDTRLEAAKKRVKQLQAQKAVLEVRKRTAEAKRQRIEDTRRKILLGATILAKVQRGEWPELRMLDLLDRELTRPDDRALFGLPEKQAPQPGSNSGAIPPDTAAI